MIDDSEVVRFLGLLEDLGYNAEEGVKDAVGVTLDEIADLQRAAAANDRGHLRDTIGVEIAQSGLDGLAGTEAWYARFPEAGTVHQAPQPAIFPALDEREEAFMRRLQKAVAEPW